MGRALLPGLVLPVVGLGAPAALFLAVTRSAPPAPMQGGVEKDGRYRLVTPWNTLFDRATLKGRPYVVWFGCTACADDTAPMLARLVRLRAALGPDGKDMPIVLITLDPERDTPERLRTFVDDLGSGVIALTGHADVLARVADNAGVFVHRTALAGGGQRVEHTGAAYLYDANDDFFGTISTKESDAQAATKLRAAIGAGMDPQR